MRVREALWYGGNTVRIEKPVRLVSRHALRKARTQGASKDVLIFTSIFVELGFSDVIRLTCTDAEAMLNCKLNTPSSVVAFRDTTVSLLAVSTRWLDVIAPHSELARGYVDRTRSTCGLRQTGATGDYRVTHTDSQIRTCRQSHRRRLHTCGAGQAGLTSRRRGCCWAAALTR